MSLKTPENRYENAQVNYSFLVELSIHFMITLTKKLGFESKSKIYGRSIFIRIFWRFQRQYSFKAFLELSG